MCVTYRSKALQEFAGFKRLIGFAGISAGWCKTHSFVVSRFSLRKNQIFVFPVMVM
jgi:hypothetical protein